MKITHNVQGFQVTLQSCSLPASFESIAESRDDPNHDLQSLWIAGKPWPAAFLFAKFFSCLKRGDFPSRPFSILELGSGTGILSIFIAKYLSKLNVAADVLVSDVGIVLDAIVANLRLNFDKNAPLAVELDWTNPTPPKSANPIKYVIATDVVYFPHLYSPLLNTLVCITDQYPDAKILLLCKKREVWKEDLFWEMLCEEFSVVPVTTPNEQWEETWAEEQYEYWFVECTRSVEKSVWMPFWNLCLE